MILNIIKMIKLIKMINYREKVLFITIIILSYLLVYKRSVIETSVCQCENNNVVTLLVPTNPNLLMKDAIFTKIYPSSINYTVLQAKDRDRLRVFVYDLPDKYNVDLLNKIEATRVSSNCDFSRTPCEELHRDEGGGSDYSVDRQYAAEVPILAKFLMLNRTTVPSDADFFIVPYFGSISKIIDGCRWGTCFKNDLNIIELSNLLPHFKDDLRRRHIFLSSRDAQDTSLLRLPLIADSAIILHYGPKQNDRDILVPPNDAGFGYPISPLKSNRNHFIFCMIGLVNDIRKQWFQVLTTFASKNPALSVQLFEILNHRQFKMTIAQVQELMKNSELCPIPQGDLPYQHRFYDVIMAGCIPVIVVYKTANYTSYYIKNNNPVGKDLDSLPFSSQIDWKSIIIEMPLRSSIL